MTVVPVRPNTTDYTHSPVPALTPTDYLNTP